MNCVQNDLVEFSVYVFMACFKWGERSSLYLQCYFKMLVLALDAQQCMMAGETNRWNILCVPSSPEGSSEEGRSCNVISSLQIDEKKPHFTS